MTDFDSLYAAHAPDVYRFALYLSGDEATAQDLTSETFVRLWTARDVRVATVRAYLFAIVRNLYRRELRVERRRVPLDPATADPAPGPEAHAAARDQLRWVAERLQALGETDRAALLMRVQHEMPYEEIAAALDLSVAAAKVRVHRARLRLSRLWKEENGGSHP
jgi:RNA polymerase sigma-70 factor (ECF subfamily)